MAALLSMAVIAVQFPHAALAETVVPDNKTIASPSQAEQETDVIVKDHSDHTGYLKSGKNNEMCHITLEPVEGGYATVSKTEALPSDTIKLEAFPEPDYRFKKWEIKDSRGIWIIYPNLDKQSTEIEMWLTDITVYAKFYNINASLSELKGFQLICNRGSYRMTASLCPVGPAPQPSRFRQRILRYLRPIP